ncbi:MAG TPA: clostripain-related cysteine peptidase [Chloroflexia bacterium]|jgi:hypothetical protein
MAAKAKRAEWTFMVYLAGDNNLAEAGETDLEEMRAVGSTSQVNVVAQFDNARSQGTKRFHIQKGGANETIEDLGPTDSGSPEVLLGFVEWAVKAYPAERYALVLWNHGGGWVPSEIDAIAKAQGTPNYNVKEATQRAATPLARAFFRTTLQRIFSVPSPAERAICSDDGTGHSLDTIELGEVLAKVQARIGKPLDLLGMDACLMSNVEVAYQVRPYVRYIVASEEVEPNAGWPYEQVLKRLVDNFELPTEELAAHIVEAYIQSYKDRGYAGDVTQTALDPSQVDRLATSLDVLAEALIEKMPAAADDMWSALRKSTYFYDRTLWDISCFCEELANLKDADIKKAAKAVQRALKRGAGNFVIAESHRGPRVDRCKGVSIYIPTFTDISPFYQELEYARDHKWLKLLTAYEGA